MTRWAMVADLNRCVGCQTCTTACKHTNATPPSVQWRKVLDFEIGEYPDVRRTFVPVGCNHCIDPPCMHVCPSTATKKRPDGIVTIDYDLCIGCAYCAVACPYQARYKVDKPKFAYGKERMRNEAVREEPRRLGVAQKCTFCVDRIDDGLANGLTPGVDPEATPACVNSCIADALHFGDQDNPESNISQLLRDNKHFSMHTELGTTPGFHYLWDKADRPEAPPGTRSTKAESKPVAGGPEGAMPGVTPWLQQHWDWRAAGNFMAGSAGTGFALFAAIATLFGASFTLTGLIALAFVGAGLFCVWLEIGRPWRFLNVLINPWTSWMTREAIVSAPLFAVGLAAVWFDTPWLALVAAAIGLVFMYCQARIVHGAKGIPAWRENRVIPLLVASGLTEGGGLFLVAGLFLPALSAMAPVAAAAVLVLVALRLWALTAYLGALRRDGAPKETLDVFGRLKTPLILGGHVLPAILLALGLAFAPVAQPGFVVGGLMAFAGGWVFKFVLITRAAYNQGFAILHTPARGAGTSGVGAKPGWIVR
jgi:phenylacetyl-CoA:acceptor oxidoreductase subunit 1